MINDTLEAIEIIRSIYTVLPKMEREGLLSPGELPLIRALIDIIINGKTVDLPLEKFSSYLYRQPFS